MKPIVAIVIFSILAALIGIFVEFMNDDIPIQSLTFFRISIGFLFIAVIIPFIDRNFLKVSRRDLFHYAIVGFLLALAVYLFHYALLLGTIANIYLITSTVILFTAILSHFFLKERLTKQLVTFILLGFFGLSLLTPFSPNNFAASLVALAQAITAAVVIILMRYEDKTHSIGNIFWYMLFASIVLLPMPFVYGIGEVGPHISSLILFGFLTISIGYILFNYALEWIEAEIVSILASITTALFAIVLAFLLLFQIPEIHVLVGGAVLLFSGAAIEKQNSKTLNKSLPLDGTKDF